MAWQTKRIDHPLGRMDAIVTPTGTWTALGNDTTGLAPNARTVSNDNALLFNKVNGTDNKTYAGIYKTLDKKLDLTWQSPLD